MQILSKNDKHYIALSEINYDSLCYARDIIQIYIDAEIDKELDAEEEMLAKRVEQKD